jgi:hypothetical protein
LFDEAFVLNSTMKKNFLFTVFYFLAFAILLFSQTKVSGMWIKADQPVPLQI